MPEAAPALDSISCQLDKIPDLAVNEPSGAMYSWRGVGHLDDGSTTPLDSVVVSLDGIPLAIHYKASSGSGGIDTSSLQAGLHEVSVQCYLERSSSNDSTSFQLSPVEVTLVFTATTHGQGASNDGYVISIDGVAAATLPENGRAEARVPVGVHSVELVGWSTNCVVTNGSVRLILAGTESLHLEKFEVVCTALTGRIEGSLLLANDLSGMPDISVSLLRDGVPVATTRSSAAGSFLFTDVAPGAYVLAPLADDLPGSGSFASPEWKTVSVYEDEITTVDPFLFRLPEIEVAVLVDGHAEQYVAVGDNVLLQIRADVSEIMRALAGVSLTVQWDSEFTDLGGTNLSMWDYAFSELEAPGQLSVNAISDLGRAGPVVLLFEADMVSSAQGTAQISVGIEQLATLAGDSIESLLAEAFLRVQSATLYIR